MTATLYQPNMQPLDILANSFSQDASSGQILQNSVKAAEVLGCDLGMLDVLACGVGYLVYTIFDHEGEANFPAMAIVAKINGIAFDALDDDAVLRGPVLVVQA